MFCGPKHFRKQEKVMRKYVRDPGFDTNQDMRLIKTNSSGKNDEPMSTSVVQNMQDSYAKRQMFYYGVEDQTYANLNNHNN